MACQLGGTRVAVAGNGPHYKASLARLVYSCCMVMVQRVAWQPAHACVFSKKPTAAKPFSKNDM